VVAGGSFAEIGGEPRLRLAELDADGGAASGWRPDPDQRVLALAAGDGALVAGGDFLRAADLDQRGVATFAGGRPAIPECPQPAPEPDPQPTATPTPTPEATPTPEPRDDGETPPAATPVATPSATPTPPFAPPPLPRFAITRVRADGTRLVIPSRPVVLRIGVTLPAALRIRFERKVGGRFRREGELRRAADAGVNRYAFAGRIAGRWLPRGLYRVRVRARDADGRAASARGPVLRIVRTRAR
jgi:hypothetical protein